MTRSPIGAGALYFAIVFTAGFVFGTARAVLTADAPALRLVAVAVELPVILVVSWFACRYASHRFAVPATVPMRGMMGVVAFVLLMAAEAVLSVLLAGRSLMEHFALYGEASHALGLAGQVIFGLLPIVQIRRL